MLSWGLALLLGLNGELVAADLPAGISAKKTGAGQYLVANGRSLYWNDRDVSAAAPTCLDACTETWPPLVAAGTPPPGDHWRILSRPDGIPQWVYKGKPLYTYTADAFPGARLGDGQQRIWHSMFEPRALPAGMTLQSTLIGRVLADHQGRTLYQGPKDAQPSNDLWQPFTAPWLALADGAWAIETDASGIRQWTYKGGRLYTYAKDRDPEDIYGHGQEGAWSAVVLEPGGGLPDWVTVERVDFGLVYANQDRMTIYEPRDIKQIQAAQTCDADCMAAYWKPILAQSEESSVGEWLIVENDQGQRQWSYRGRLLYTHTRDNDPGDMIGNGIGVGYRIGAGFRVILLDPRERPR